MNLTSLQHLINDNIYIRYNLELKYEIDLLTLLLSFPQFSSTQSISCSTFFSSPPLSLSLSLSFSVSLSLFLSSRLSRHHVIPQSRCLPPPSNCRRLQQRQTATTRARERIDTRTRAHIHLHIHMHTQTRYVSASGRHTDGYGCHGSSAVLHSPSSLRSPFFPLYSRLRHALRLIHSFSPSLSRQPAISFQGCRW